MIASNVFDLYPDAFRENPQANEACVQIYGRCKNQRVYRWIKKKYILTNPYLEAYNVFVPEANGTGAIGEVLSTPLIGEPLIGVTDTFISIGKFKTLTEALNCTPIVGQITFGVFL